MDEFNNGRIILKPGQSDFCINLPHHQDSSSLITIQVYPRKDEPGETHETKAPLMVKKEKLEDFFNRNKIVDFEDIGSIEIVLSERKSEEGRDEAYDYYESP